eukprot:1161547-Pelagomonas_calceolata.AAC.5
MDFHAMQAQRRWHWWRCARALLRGVSQKTWWSCLLRCSWAGCCAARGPHRWLKPGAAAVAAAAAVLQGGGQRCWLCR